MKRILLHICIALLGASSFLPTDDLVRIPNLVSHYQQHCRENADVSIVDFLSLHYGGQATHHHEEGSEGHQELPFTSSDYTSTQAPKFMSSATLPLSVPVEITEVAYRIARVIATSRISNSIWQPPRLA